MLEIKVPGQRYSAYWNGVGVALAFGQWVKPNGTAAAGLGPSPVGGPQYAQTGDPVVTVASGLDTHLGPVYPVKQHLFQAEDSDKALTTVASGQYLVYYDGGDYETDNYGVIAAGATFGTRLFLDGSGRLCTATGGRAVAMFLAVASTYDSTYQDRALVQFRMLPFPVNVTG